MHNGCSSWTTPMTWPWCGSSCHWYGGHILLTTRAAAMGRLAQRIEVEKLDVDVGALFLLRRAGILAPDASLEQASARDRETALEITREMDGLPLALDQAG